MNKKAIITSIITIIILAGAAVYYQKFFITDGVAIIPSAEERDLITLTEPISGDTVVSPLLIMGQARGTWFFEGDFPVVLTDWDGLIIAEGYATAQSDWMTEDYVPFITTLDFEKPAYGNTGNLILQKANPTGDPEFDDALEIQIKF